jgi:hypothetical protein
MAGVFRRQDGLDVCNYGAAACADVGRALFAAEYVFTFEFNQPQLGHPEFEDVA